MTFSINDGWLSAVRQVKSPNCDGRPADVDINLLVVHGISLPPGQYGGSYIEQLFCNCLDPDGHPYFAEIADLQVSSHVLIRRDGELIQFVPLHKRAWHAGKSSFEGRACCNDFSVGIELEGCDDEAYTSIQYAQLAELSASLMKYFPGLEGNRIVGHSDISPGRKTDPGPAFDWDHFRKLLSGDRS